MKELTIEQKAKLYDKALDRARKLKEDPQSVFCGYSSDTFTICDYIFPELQESEDERIRKEIIEYIKTGTYHKSWIDWLEKQGLKETTWNKEDEENINNVLYILNQLKETSPYEEDDIAEKTINWLKSLKDIIEG